MKNKKLTIEEVNRTIMKVKSQLKAGPRNRSIRPDLGFSVALYMGPPPTSWTNSHREPSAFLGEM